MNFGDALMAVVGGGATGLIGTVVTQVAAHKERQAVAADKILERAHELKAMEFEAAANANLESIKRDGAMAVAESARQGAESIASSQALQASHASDGRKYATSGKSAWFVVVDVVRGLMRPVLTVAYTGLAIYILVVLYTLVDKSKLAIEPTEAFGLFKEVVLLVLYMASATCLWWFGTRPPEKKK